MTQVQGRWDASLSRVAEAFARNFAEYEEQGAALAIVKDDQVLATMWAGSRDRAANPWLEDTCVNVFSAGKPLVAAVIMTLVDEGLLDLDRPIGDYWPGFATRGKEPITTRQVLNHTSGLSAFHPRLKDPVIYHRPSVNSLLEYEQPWWSPGSAQGYSPFLYGWILAELACRLDGDDDFAGIFARRIAAPLGIEAYFGVPEQRHASLAQVAPLSKPLGSLGSASEGANSAALGQLMKADPRGVTNRAFTNPMTLMNSTNSSQWRSACIPAANCHTNALSLARFYADLVGGHCAIAGAAVRERFTREQSAQRDKVLGVDLTFGLGFMLSRDLDDCRFASLSGFGHPGAGGSVGFADPERGLGVAYVTARLGQSLLIDARAQNLIRALEACL